MKKILTIILDGFGYREEEHGNAIKLANLTNFNHLWENFPHTTLFASEEKVGLRPGQFGNSEIGHMTIGAGRKIKSNTILIDEFLENKSQDNRYQEFVNYLTEKPKPLHIIGLLSDGDVHSHLNHLFNIIDDLKRNTVNDVYFHLITDGRDTKENVSLQYIKMLEEKIKDKPNYKIATICGRYYAMDRDKKWERTKIYYDLITKGIGISSSNIEKSIQSSYNNKTTDEFIKPIILNKNGVIKNGDTILWINYREDRAVQILESLSNPNFAHFASQKFSESLIFSFFPFDNPIKTYSFMDLPKVDNPLGIYLSKLGLTQARIAETEKYAHVTYFFDGTYEGKVEKCDKYSIPSPKVATYDLQPEMSAIEVTKKVINCLEKDYDFILVNYANPDMVGHTGNLEAAIKACMAADLCLGKLIEVADDNFYKLIVLSDHGNADIMLDENNQKVTSHTTSKVPFIIVDRNVSLKDNGDITMVAPTILDYMDIATPKEMEETESLIKQ